jgi:uncharacterized protein YpmS
LKYHAFKEATYKNLTTCQLEVEVKEFIASTDERLREFIEAYWLDYNLSEETWKNLLRGDAITFKGHGTIHLEIED